MYFRKKNNNKKNPEINEMTVVLFANSFVLLQLFAHMSKSTLTTMLAK